MSKHSLKVNLLSFSIFANFVELVPYLEITKFVGCSLTQQMSNG